MTMSNTVNGPVLQLESHFSESRCLNLNVMNFKFHDSIINQ